MLGKSFFCYGNSHTQLWGACDVRLDSPAFCLVSRVTRKILWQQFYKAWLDLQTDWWHMGWSMFGGLRHFWLAITVTLPLPVHAVIADNSGPNVAPNTAGIPLPLASSCFTECVPGEAMMATHMWQQTTYGPYAWPRSAWCFMPSYICLIVGRMHWTLRLSHAICRQSFEITRETFLCLTWCFMGIPQYEHPPRKICITINKVTKFELSLSWQLWSQNECHITVSEWYSGLFKKNITPLFIWLKLYFCNSHAFYFFFSFS